LGIYKPIYHHENSDLMNDMRA